jgi:hypothetical protein
LSLQQDDVDGQYVDQLFKALKQTLKIKTFVGTSANAVRTQVWTALIAMLEIAVLLVAIDAGRFASAAIVLLSRSVGVVRRPFWGSTGAGRSARRCATACNHVVGAVGQQKTSHKAATLIPGGI